MKSFAQRGAENLISTFLTPCSEHHFSKRSGGAVYTQEAEAGRILRVSWSCQAMPVALRCSAGISLELRLLEGNCSVSSSMGCFTEQARSSTHLLQGCLRWK